MILEGKNINKSYITSVENISVLNNLNIAIKKREIVVVKGPSGAGKSTLLNILGTIDLPDDGEIVIDGEKIDFTKDMSNIRARKLGFVFQHHHLLPEFTVMENLTIPQTLIGKTKVEAVEIASNLLDKLGLLNRGMHYPSQLSGGEKQRIAIIRAVVNSPLITLADEPTGNLDSKNSKILLELILELRDKMGLSYIIASHDETVAKIADRVLLLNSGNFMKSTRI